MYQVAENTEHDETVLRTESPDHQSRRSGDYKVLSDDRKVWLNKVYSNRWTFASYTGSYKVNKSTNLVSYRRILLMQPGPGITYYSGDFVMVLLLLNSIFLTVCGFFAARFIIQTGRVEKELDTAIKVLRTELLEKFVLVYEYIRKELVDKDFCDERSRRIAKEKGVL